MPSNARVSYGDAIAALEARAARKTAVLAEYREIDRRLRLCKFRAEHAVTRETEAARITIHDKAHDNPLLRAMLRAGKIAL